VANLLRKDRRLQGKDTSQEALSPQEYAATTKAKRAGKAAGKQFVAQPKNVAAKTARHRKIK
jgi:hypothetical protein